MSCKIFQFSFGDGYAGSAKIAILSSEELIKRGYDVTLFASTHSLTEKRAREKGIKVISLDSRHKFRSLMIDIRKEFDLVNPDFVSAYHSLDRKVGMKLKSIYKKKIITIANRQNISRSVPIIGSILYNLYYDYQIACSKGVAKSLSNSGIRKNKIKVIHNCVEVPDNIDEISGDAIKSRFAFEGKVVLGLSTWFHKERKGFDILFKAFAPLPGNYVFLIVGIPEDTQNEVREYAATFGCDPQKIFMPGYVENIWEYYKAMDIFLLPSRSEGFSLALLEAGAASLPIIASDIPGNNEFVNNGVNGLLFQINNPTELKDKIELLANNVELKNLISKNAKKDVFEKYLISNYANSFDEFLKKIKK